MPGTAGLTGEGLRRGTRIRLTARNMREPSGLRAIAMLLPLTILLFATDEAAGLNFGFRPLASTRCVHGTGSEGAPPHVCECAAWRIGLSIVPITSHFIGGVALPDVQVVWIQHEPREAPCGMC